MNTSKKSMSLKSKLISINVGLLFALGTGTFLLTKHLINEDIEGQSTTFEQFADNMDNAVSAQFFERYGDVQTFSISPAIRSSSKKTIVESLNAFGALYGIYDLIMVVDANGRLIAVNNKAPDGTDIKADSLYQANYKDAPWFKSAMAGTFTDDKTKGFSGTFVEEVQIDPYTSAVYGGKRLGNSFTTTIKDESGKVIGVITNRAAYRWFDVAFKEAFTLMKQQHLNGSEILMLNKEGVLTYSYSGKNFDAKTDEERFNWDALLKQNLAEEKSESVTALMAGKSGHSVEANSTKKEEQLVSYTPIDGPKMVSSLGWKILVRDNASETFENAYRAEKLFYLIFTLLMVTGVLTAFWFSNHLAKRLLELASHLAEGGVKVATAANEISMSSAALSEASVEQAAAIQETAASIDEVSAMVKKNSENAQHSQETSKHSRESAQKGQESVQRMIQSISDISDSNALIMNSVADGNKKISEIVQLISEIGNKTKVINDIVFQTKLLSFNASVEAARAGEHGKGFAVVAEEVGNLAQMSGNAAKEISEMLDGSIQKVESIINETKTSVERLVHDGKGKVEAGKNTATECGVILGELLGAVSDVDGMVAEISTASKEQSQGVEEINKAMNQLDMVTHQNTAVSQQTAASAEALSNQSQQLKKLVSDLSFLVTGTMVDAHDEPLKKNKNNVVHLKAAKAAKDAQTKKKELKPMAPESSLTISKVAANGGGDLPQHNDPRFEEV